MIRAAHPQADAGLFDDCPLGMFLVAHGANGDRAVAALILYATGHAVPASRVLHNKHGSMDETELHGVGRPGGTSGWLFLFGALALAGLPVTGIALSKSLGEEELSAHGGVGVAALLHRVHSGHVGDYVAWLLLDVAVCAALIIAWTGWATR